MQRELFSDQSQGMLRAEAAPAGADIRCGSSAEVLRQVQQPGVSLGLWQRQPDAELATWLAQSLPTRYQLKQYATGDAFAVAAFVDQALAASPLPVRAQDKVLRARFVADLAQLVELFLELRPESRQHTLHVKLAAVDRADCPVLHSDWVTLRLICTYVGAGTEYAAAHSVERTALCQPLGSPAETNAAILRDPQALRRMPTFAVGVMRGNGYPGPAGRGLVHRSPPGSSGRRIKLIIDSTLPPEEQDA